MRKLTCVGAVMAGLLLSGCTGQNSGMDDGWALIKAKDYAAARTHYQSVLAEEPTNPYANLNLGVALEELGDTGMAAKYYQAAVVNGADAGIAEVAEDGNVAGRRTTVKKVAEENLAKLGS